MKKVFLMLVLVWKKGLAIWLFPPIFNNLRYINVAHWICSYVWRERNRQIVSIFWSFTAICDMTKILDEWEILKTYVVPMIINNKSLVYLLIWKCIFTNHEVKAECMNVLDVLEITVNYAFYKYKSWKNVLTHGENQNRLEKSFRS